MTQRSGPPRPWAALAMLLGALAFVAVVTVALLELVVARPPPPHLEVSGSPAGPPLTRHLALVVVDGLRFDVATDPAWMPNVSRLFRERASGEIWSNRVSMTSSAILTYATGQPGDIDQIVNNESGRPVAYDHLMAAVRAVGLTTAYTGDRAWMKMYPGAWNALHPDPPGVAIDVDYNAEIFAAARELLALPVRPSFLVIHFVTPDHQAHAYGTFSDRYRAHIRAFDEALRVLLDEIPSDTTVFLTSDHGATDTGTHGSDTPVQRRCPIVAWGPGIVEGRKEARALHQIDLAATFATLLGVRSPAHGRGHVLADWLDLPDERRAVVACKELDRLARYAAAEGADDATIAMAGAACEHAEPRARIEAAREAARALDQAIEAGGTIEGGGNGPLRGWLAPLFAVAGAAALAFAALRPCVSGSGRLARAIGAFTVPAAVAVALTYSVELLPGQAPNAVRVVLYVVGNGILAAALLWPARAVEIAERRPLFAAMLLPGVLASTPTRVTQVQSFVVVCVVVFLAVTVGLSARAGARIASPSTWIGSRTRVLCAALLLAALGPTGVLEHRFLPKVILAEGWRTFSFACVTVALFAAYAGVVAHRRGTMARSALVEAAVGLAVVVASLWLRSRAPALVCLSGWLGLPVVAALAWSRGAKALAALCAFGSWAWVSRDPEVPILVGTWTIAIWLGDALREEERRRPGALSSVAPLLSIVAFLFAWGFVQRIGVQLGIEFTHFDWGAAAFRQEGVSLFRIGAGLAYKHVFARAVIVATVLAALPADVRRTVARGLLAVELGRAAVLTATLHVCKASFWTALRAIGDVPHALAAVVVGAGAVLIVELDLLRDSRADGRARRWPRRCRTLVVG